MADRISYFRQKGDPFVLGTGLALILTLGMVVFILSVILIKGLGFFWPGDLVELTLSNKTYLGELWDENIKRQIDDTGQATQTRELQLKIGNRELYGSDFKWIDEEQIVSRNIPQTATAFERYEYGNFYGYIRAVNVGDSSYGNNVRELFDKAEHAHELARDNRSRKLKLEKKLNNLITPLSRLQREISLLEIENQPDIEVRLNALKTEAADLESDISEEYVNLSNSIQKLTVENRGIYLMVETADGRPSEIHLAKVVRFYQPNDMNLFQKSGMYIGKLWEFVSANPRESNTEGGVFPAIFGTVLMVLLMSIAVVPFGVLAALYLNEYARQGTVIRLIRLSVNNLAGVPSIVFGIFGLGFLYIYGGRNYRSGLF